MVRRGLLGQGLIAGEGDSTFSPCRVNELLVGNQSFGGCVKSEI